MRFDASYETCPDFSDQKVLFIPVDEANRHYNQYLEWVGAGNTTLPSV